jgi:hypothetical protein
MESQFPKNVGDFFANDDDSGGGDDDNDLIINIIGIPTCSRTKTLAVVSLFHRRH